VPKRRGYNLELSVGMGEYSRKMLTDFINTLADPTAFERFNKKYERRERSDDGSVYILLWHGDFEYFKFIQAEMRAIWEGRKKGSESMQLNLRLGLLESTEDHQFAPPPIRADWRQSSLHVWPNTLADVVWLTLLQHSQRLGICENKDAGDCPTPYFLKYRPSTRFCSEACALTAQRESKRRWWREHGHDWLNKRASMSKSRRKGKKHDL
jgi:hypothetical protein